MDRDDDDLHNDDPSSHCGTLEIQIWDYAPTLSKKGKKRVFLGGVTLSSQALIQLDATRLNGGSPQRFWFALTNDRRLDPSVKQQVMAGGRVELEVKE